ncbi:hypothetical protein ACLB2K_043056 [Fragaria x ananassa]
MSLQGKVEAEFEITAPADKFYNIFKIEAHLVPNTSQTDSITGVQVHEGDWETDGSIKIWNYAIEGEVGTFKERVELDEVNKTITLKGEWIGRRCVSVLQELQAYLSVHSKG